MIQDLSNHIFVWRELKELNNSITGTKYKTCVDPKPLLRIPGTPENCPGTTDAFGRSSMRKRTNGEVVRRIGISDDKKNPGKRFKHEDMKNGLYRANAKLYEDPTTTDDCTYNPNNTLQDLSYLTDNPCNFDSNTTLMVNDYTNNWRKLKDVIKKFRDISGQAHKDTFVFSGHQHNLQNMFFKFKKKSENNFIYGFANCSCVEVKFDRSMNILDVNIIYQGMYTEKGVMLDIDNKVKNVERAQADGAKYGYVNGNLIEVLDQPKQENFTIRGDVKKAEEPITAIFIRHGNAFHNKPYEIRRNDSLLTPHGIQGSLDINIGKKLNASQCVFITSPLIRCIMTLCGFIKNCVNYKNEEHFSQVDRIFTKIIEISRARLGVSGTPPFLTGADYYKLLGKDDAGIISNKFETKKAVAKEKQAQYEAEEGKGGGAIKRRGKTKRRKRNKTKKHKRKKQKRSKRRNKKTHK